MNATATPERTCIGCRTKRPQVALVRVAMTADGRLVVDRTAPGRGAWLCSPPNACFEMARKRRGFDKAFRQPVDVAAIDELSRVWAVPRNDGVWAVPRNDGVWAVPRNDGVWAVPRNDGTLREG